MNTKGKGKRDEPVNLIMCHVAVSLGTNHNRNAKEKASHG